MLLEKYFRNLRCEHADATKLVLVGDNAAGSCSAEQVIRRRSSLDFGSEASPIPPMAPRRLESWNSATPSLTDSIESALSILEETEDDFSDDEDFSCPSVPRLNHLVGRAGTMDRFFDETKGGASLLSAPQPPPSGHKELPPAPPTRMLSPVFVNGRKVLHDDRTASPQSAQRQLQQSPC